MSDAAFRRMTDALPHLVWTARADGSATGFNQRWLDYTGLSHAESLTEGWASRVHPDDSQRTAALWIQSMADGQPLDIACRLRGADDNYRWMQCRSMPQCDDAGRTTGWAGSFTDINDLKLASEQLDKTLSMKRIAGRVALLGGWTIDLPERNLTWSDENCAIHDVPPGYVPTLQEGVGYFLPEHRAQVMACVEACAVHGTPYEFTLPKLTAKGRKIWVRSIGEAERDADGKIVRLQGAFQDITQQRANQAHLRLLEAAVSRLNDIVVVMEVDELDGAATRVIFVNDAFERHTGYSRKELFQDTAGVFRMLQADRAGLDQIRTEMTDGKAVRAEIPLQTRHGQELWLELDVAPIADDSDTFTHWVAVGRAITERRQQQQEILSLNSDLEQRVTERTAELATANRELASFAYSVSHDLRSPLNTIDAFSQLLLKLEGKNISDKGKHYLDRIHVGVKHMGELIEGLLTLTHLSRGEIKSEAVDMSALALQIEKACRRRDPEKNPQVRIQPGMSAQGDTRLLAAVLQNLMDNAWKFTSRQALAVIEVGCEPAAEGEHAFFVRDNGAGFDMAFSARLFGTFERLHSPGEFPGTGIGLATVKRVIERHGGKVWAQGKVGEGATFYFTLGQTPASQAR